MKASCDDLILLGAAQKQYGADENTPEHPADPFTTLDPTRGYGGPSAAALMPCEGDSEWLRDHGVAGFSQICTASHSRKGQPKQRGRTALLKQPLAATAGTGRVRITEG